MSSSSARSTKPATIDDLPTEMIRELFKYLSPKDLAACSLVNKRWHSIHSDFRLNSLVVRSSSIPECAMLHFKWYDAHHSNQRIAYSYRSENFLRLLKRPLLTNLKRLALHWHREFEFDLNELNKFSQLVQLEIDNPAIEAKRVILKLPMLTVLVLQCVNDHCVFSVDCPVLKVLVYDEGNKAGLKSLLVVKHPETICKLDTNMVGTKLAPFKSVECLVTGQFKLINKHTLLSLPRLKELHFTRRITRGVAIPIFLEYSDPFDAICRLKEALNEFLSDVKELRGADFRFTFSGFQMHKWTFEQIDFGVREWQSSELERSEWERSEWERLCDEHLYMKNPQLIDPEASLDFVQRFDYTRLMHVVAGEIPSWLFKRFTNIRSVETTARVDDPEHFRWFLSSLRTVSGLYLKNAELAQEFYDQLPAAVPLLGSLHVLEYGHVDEMRLNFDFIARLPHLSWLSIWPELPPESIAWLVTWLAGRLESGGWSRVSFRLSRIRLEIKITKIDNLFEIGKGYKTVFKTKDPNKILNYLEKIEVHHRTELGLMPYLSQSVQWVREAFCDKFRKLL